MIKITKLISLLLVGGFVASASAGIWEVCAFQSFFWNYGCGTGPCTDATPCKVDFWNGATCDIAHWGTCSISSGAVSITEKTYQCTQQAGGNCVCDWQNQIPSGSTTYKGTKDNALCNGQVIPPN